MTIIRVRRMDGHDVLTIWNTSGLCISRYCIADHMLRRLSTNITIHSYRYANISSEDLI